MRNAVPLVNVGTHVYFTPHATRFLKKCAFDECCMLWRHRLKQDGSGCNRPRGIATAQNIALQINRVLATRYKAGFGILLKSSSHLAESARQVVVVGTLNSQNLARSAGHALGYGINKTIVPRRPPNKTVTVFFKHINGFIG